MRISLIVAISENGVIGNQNVLPWHLPEELRYFKKITLNKPIIMGRKTFESMGSKPLPKRRNIILTHSDMQVPNCWVVRSVQEALVAAGHCEEVIVIGGAKVYTRFLPLVSRIYLTIVHQQCVGDTYFPEVNWEQWEKVLEQEMNGFTTKIFDRRSEYRHGYL